jgi:hypothetical protein
MDKSYVLAVDITEFPELSLEQFVPRSGTGTRSKKQSSVSLSAAGRPQNRRAQKERRIAPRAERRG